MKYEQSTGVSIQMAFEQFHRDNPRVYELFKQFVREVIVRERARGKRDRDIHISADFILHRIRWEVFMTTQADDGFKINNNFTSRYARLFARDHPGWAHLFQLREIKSA